MNIATENQRHFSKRLIFLHLTIFIIFFVLIRQLLILQIEKGTYYRELSIKNRIRRVIIQPPRGKIYARGGEILVDNRPRFDITSTKEDIKDIEKTSQILSKIFKKDYQTIHERITDTSSQLPYEPSIILTDLTMNEVSIFAEHAHLLSGVDLKTIPVRSYLHSNLACHLLGYTGRISKKEYNLKKDQNYTKNDEIGKDGIESSFEHYLKGIHGARQIQINSFGRLDRVLGEKKPLIGHNLYLTIDLKIQKAAEHALKDKTGSIIAINPVNGDVYAMCSHPGFDPNFFSTGHRSKISKYFVDPDFPLLNRSISSEFAPGSTFKPIVALAALKNKLITHKTSIFCNGVFKLGSTEFKCWRKWGHGETNALKSIEQSCNLFYYNIGKELNHQHIYDMAYLFGLGELTNISLSGERKGLLPNQNWKKKRFKESSMQKWHLGDTINYSIGQGYLLTTPIQLAYMTAAIAMNGQLATPNLINKIINSQTGETITLPNKPLIDLKINPEHMNIIRKGMVDVVNAKYGTGRKARLKNIKVCGKTGTAQSVKKGKPTKNAWFISFAPYENPEIVVIILVQDAESGGQDAAPLAKKILASYFGIELNETSEEEKAITTNMDEENAIENIGIQNTQPNEQERSEQ